MAYHRLALAPLQQRHQWRSAESCCHVRTRTRAPARSWWPTARLLAPSLTPLEVSSPSKHLLLLLPRRVEQTATIAEPELASTSRPTSDHPQAKPAAGTSSTQPTPPSRVAAPPLRSSHHRNRVATVELRHCSAAGPLQSTSDPESYVKQVRGEPLITPMPWFRPSPAFPRQILVVVDPAPTKDMIASSPFFPRG
jgi:hypothetical protein